MQFHRVFLLATIVLCVCSLVGAQNLDFERSRHKDMLRGVKEDVKKHYFDPAFKGLDIDANFTLALAKLDKAQSIGQMSGIIAQFLLDFDDSHLFFLPPGKASKTDYGFTYRMVGEKCFVVQVDKKSEAELTGLRIGDEIATVEGYQPTRDTLWKLQYLFNTLRPLGGLRLTVIKPDGKRIDYGVPAKVTQGRKVMDLTGNDLNEYMRESEDRYQKRVKQYVYDKLDGVFIWKMPSFSLETARVDDIMGRARKAPAIIFDLRDNSGGRVDMLLRLVGNVLDKDTKVADEKKRKETKEMIAKSRGQDAYTGKIIVLIDSGSASASEVFARVIQLEKRGQVFGDRSAGAVMESRYFGRTLGMDTIIAFGSSITIADLIMKDGKSLEKNGVVPDVVIIPTGKDVAGKRDIVLSKAIESLGLSMTPEVAGALFPDEDPDSN